MTNMCTCEDCGRLRADSPPLNVELLDKTLDYIKTLEAFRADGVEMDERWNQASWGIQGPECGTAMCFAGWACKLAGKRLVVERMTTRWLDNERREAGVLVVEDDDGGRREISEVASELLGLNVFEKTLYDGSNDLSDLESTVARIKAGAYRDGKGAA